MLVDGPHPNLNLKGLQARKFESPRRDLLHQAAWLVG